MDHTMTVQVCQRVRHRNENAFGEVRVERPSAAQAPLERLAAHVLHHRDHGLPVAAELEARHDMRMRKALGDQRFPAKPLPSLERCGEHGIEHFERDFSAVAPIPCQPHLSHPTSAERLDDFVFPTQRARYALGQQPFFVGALDRLPDGVGHYCDRMVIAGSIRAARSAGIQQATSPMTAIITVTPTSVVGSYGSTPNSRPRMTRAAMPARARPNTTPIATNTNPSLRTMRCTRRLSAPRLMRMPISFVRALTENPKTPAIPTAAMITAKSPNDDTSAAVRRQGAIFRSLYCATVITSSMRAVGAIRRAMRVAVAVRPATLVSAGITRPAPRAFTSGTPRMIGVNNTGTGSALSPPSCVLPTRPTTVRHGPHRYPTESPCHSNHATRLPMGSYFGNNRSARAWLMILP